MLFSQADIHQKHAKSDRPKKEKGTQDSKMPTIAERPRKKFESNSFRSVEFAPLEMTNTEHSQFPMPSMLGARPLGFHSSVRSSSNICSS